MVAGRLVSCYKNLTHLQKQTFHTNRVAEQNTINFWQKLADSMCRKYRHICILKQQYFSTSTRSGPVSIWNIKTVLLCISYKP